MLLAARWSKVLLLTSQPFLFQTKLDTAQNTDLDTFAAKTAVLILEDVRLALGSLHFNQQASRL